MNPENLQNPTNNLSPLGESCEQGNMRIRASSRPPRAHPDKDAPHQTPAALQCPCVEIGASECAQVRLRQPRVQPAPACPSADVTTDHNVVPAAKNHRAIRIGWSMVRPQKSARPEIR